MEFDDQQRVRFADQHAIDGGAEDRDAAAEIDHGAIDQLDRLRVELHDVLRRLHRAAKRRELADAQQLARLDRMQREFDRGGEGEGALRSHQQPSQIFLTGEPRDRRQHFDVIAADAAKLRGKARGDLLCFRRAQRPEPLDQLGDAAGHVGADIVRQQAELVLRAIGQDRVDRAHVVCHQPVAYRLRAAGVVAGHATDRAAGMRRGIDREKQAVLTQRGIQMTQHQPRFDQRRPRIADRHAGCGADVSSSLSPGRGSPSGRTGWCRRRAAAPARPPRARSTSAAATSPISSGTITPIGST